MISRALAQSAVLLCVQAARPEGAAAQVSVQVSVSEYRKHGCRSSKSSPETRSGSAINRKVSADLLRVRSLVADRPELELQPGSRQYDGLQA